MSNIEERIISPACRASYPKLFEPEINKQGKKVYGLALLIEDTPEGHAFLKKAEEVAEACGRQKFGKRFDDVLGFARQHGGPKWAVRKDLINKYKDCKPAIIGVINARSYDTPPGIVSEYADPATGKAAKVNDPSLIYPGCYVKVSLRPYATDLSENKAVSFALGNVQLLMKKGERIDNRTSAEDEFSADPNAKADLSDL